MPDSNTRHVEWRQVENVRVVQVAETITQISIIFKNYLGCVANSNRNALNWFGVYYNSYTVPDMG